MPFAYVGAATALVGAGTSIANAVSSPSNGAGGTSGGSASTYIPQGQAGADNLYQQIFNSQFPGATGIPGQVQPAAQGAFGNIQNNPYASQEIGSAFGASQYGLGTTVPQLQSSSGQLYGSATGALPYGGQILNTAFDPRNALYNTTQQRVSDQSNAINAQSGVASSPYGAGVAAENNSNFNIDWQNQQLQRQQQGIQGYGSLLSSVGKGFEGAGQLGNQAVAGQSAYGALPYSTYLGNQNDVLSGANSYSGAVSNSYGAENNLANLLNAYLGRGQAATSQALVGQQQGFNQGQTNMSNLGSSLSGISNGFSNIFGGSGSSGYNPGSNSNIYSPGQSDSSVPLDQGY